MEIAFHKRPLRQLCENEARAKQDFGDEVAEKLKRRLADMRAAKSVKDLIAGCPKELDHSPGFISINLCSGQHMLFSVNQRSVPKDRTGKINWSKVNRIKIIEIGPKND